MGGNRDDFSERTKDCLAKRAAYRCCNPNCRKQTCGAAKKIDSYVNIGVAAHICAAAPGGKRYDKTMTVVERKSIFNGIWLCQSCAKLIDSDEERYTVEMLHKWKIDAENETMQEIDGGRLAKIERYTPDLDGLLLMIYECDSLEEAAKVSYMINCEIDRLVEALENIQSKMNQNEDERWVKIYGAQFEAKLSLLRSLDILALNVKGEIDDIADRVHEIKDAVYEKEIIRIEKRRKMPYLRPGVSYSIAIDKLPIVDVYITDTAKDLYYKLCSVWHRVELAIERYNRIQEERQIILVE